MVAPKITGTARLHERPQGAALGRRGEDRVDHPPGAEPNRDHRGDEGEGRASAGGGRKRGDRRRGGEHGSARRERE